MALASAKWRTSRLAELEAPKRKKKKNLPKMDQWESLLRLKREVVGPPRRRKPRKEEGAKVRANGKYLNLTEARKAAKAIRVGLAV